MGVVRGLCDGSVEGVVGGGTCTGDGVEGVRFCVAWMQIGGGDRAGEFNVGGADEWGLREGGGVVEGVVGCGTCTGDGVEAVRFCVAWMQIGGGDRAGEFTSGGGDEWGLREGGGVEVW
eukprot:CAMPEP_0174912796 /NCGR_PEP_ID=MMETSP0167-20121228/79972_1 /TAXON_ID=38298 /ORGANISM="Rhodella maculata, Strain CCMP736" /LENGTH=118 /DNA_ID=CAMNT_0016157465 /DNA_START=748 /DNA_END=1103 /DNA_ORIENTATION=-